MHHLSGWLWFAWTCVPKHTQDSGRGFCGRGLNSERLTWLADGKGRWRSLANGAGDSRVVGSVRLSSATLWRRSETRVCGRSGWCFSSPVSVWINNQITLTVLCGVYYDVYFMQRAIRAKHHSIGAYRSPFWRHGSNWTAKTTAVLMCLCFLYKLCFISMMLYW